MLAEADLVVAAPWVSEQIAHRLRGDATVVDSAALEQDPKLMIKAAKAGQVALRLFGGDPFLFCAAATDADGMREGEGRV